MPHFKAISLRILGLALGLTSAAHADFSDKTKALECHEGLIETCIDHKKAQVLIALSPEKDGTLGRYIYTAYLTGGLGSNPAGLDRSLPAETRILAFRRAGDKVVAVIENTAFQASGSAAEKRAVETSFAQSIIWSSPILDEDSKTGQLLVDLSSFLTRDAVGVASRLSGMGEGNFSVDADRSYVDTQAALTFPINMEFDAYITFGGSQPGPEVRGTTPIPEAITLLAHTTFMKLPEPGYKVRHSDERAGLLDFANVDMSAPLDGNTVVRIADRFRLQKDKNGNVIKPIVFYIDNAAPEPIRSALKEGASWWADAFAAAGFPGGYKVEILPEGVHPLDARYNVVNWVHRATRGWSYGVAIYDPRTGETLRGAVLLGSLRIRQDIKIFEALAGTAKTGTGAKDDPIELALMRIRQLAAHEVGHALGFGHNMAASTVAGGGSVMDYPAPDIRLKADGSLDFSHIYGVGIGEWDKWLAKFLYSDYSADEKTAQAKLIEEADKAGLLYVSDPDSRPASSGHTRGALWDTGSDPLESLENTLKVRATALSHFGEANLRPGESADALQTKFVPLYLYHRYQLQAAAKTLGGSYFTYRHQGDNRPLPQPADWQSQEKALNLLLQTVSPETLDIPQNILMALSPTGDGMGDPQFWRETFHGGARPMFDPLHAAGVAADITFEAMLASPRLTRVSDQSLVLKGHPGLDGVLRKIVDTVMTVPRGENLRYTRIRAIVANRLTAHLITLLQSKSTALTVRTSARAALLLIRKHIDRSSGYMASAGSLLTATIDAALDPKAFNTAQIIKGPDIPPGSPIGMDGLENCWHCETDFAD